MTLENSKRLMEHYKAVGNKVALADMQENFTRRGVSASKSVSSKDSKKE